MMYIVELWDCEQKPAQGAHARSSGGLRDHSGSPIVSLPIDCVGLQLVGSRLSLLSLSGISFRITLAGGCKSHQYPLTLAHTLM